jgi:hypothetical protein
VGAWQADAVLGHGVLRALVPDPRVAVVADGETVNEYEALLALRVTVATAVAAFLKGNVINGKSP